MPPVSKKNSHGQDNGQDYGHNGLDYDPKVAEQLRQLRMEILDLCDGKPERGTRFMLQLLTPKPPKPIPPTSPGGKVAYWVFVTRPHRDDSGLLRPGCKRV